ELELTGLGGKRDRRVETQGLEADLVDHLGDGWIHLAWHDTRTRLHGRERDLGKAGARAGGEESDVVSDLVGREHRGAEPTAERRDVSHRLHELDTVARFPQLKSGTLGEVLHHEPRIPRLGVDPGAARRPADVHLPEPLGRLLQLLTM